MGYREHWRELVGRTEPLNRSAGWRKEAEREGGEKRSLLCWKERDVQVREVPREEIGSHDHLEASDAESRDRSMEIKWIYSEL